MDTPPEKKRFPLVTALIETFGFSPALATAVALFLSLLCALALVWVIRSAPPDKLVLVTGPEGSSFHRWGTAYQKALASHGITLEVHPSAGALDNLQQLRSSTTQTDLGFVSGGIAKDEDVADLVSLGSVAYQPLMVFYRSSSAMTRLSELAGKRIAVGAIGSGTRTLVLTLLRANAITGEPTTFVDLDAEAAAAALIQGDLDAVFLMGDSAPIQTLRTLVRTREVQLFSFAQADAYVRRHAFLNKIVLPQGSIDLGANLPAQDVELVGPTVELVARRGLNSALSDIVLEVARGVHSRAGLLQKRGEFPAPLEQDFPLSQDALRYYKDGLGFFHRTFHSFWLANLSNRILVAIVPFVLVLIPALRLLPVAYRLGIQLRLYRCYRPLLRIERETFSPLPPERVQELLRRVDEVEDAVNRLKIPASFADRFYWLRSHISFVRQRLQSRLPASSVN